MKKRKTTPEPGLKAKSGCSPCQISNITNDWSSGMCIDCYRNEWNKNLFYYSNCKDTGYQVRGKACPCYIRSHCRQAQGLRYLEVLQQNTVDGVIYNDRRAFLTVLEEVQNQGLVEGSPPGLGMLTFILCPCLEQKAVPWWERQDHGVAPAELS